MPFADLDGIDIHYEVTGTGHPVVLVHGHGLDSRLWMEQAPALSRSYTVVRYDLRGHGRSQASSTGYSRPHYTGELHRLILHLGFSRPSLVGHSLGGSVALEYALAHPDRLAALVLTNTGLEGFSYGKKMSNVVAKQKALLQREGMSAKFLRATLISPIFDGVRRQPAKLALVKEMLAAWAGSSWLDRATYPPPAKLHIERLGEIRAPTLVMVGEQDIEGFHQVAELLTQRIAVTRKAIVPQAGHLAPLENPEAFNDILLDFLGGAAGKALV